MRPRDRLIPVALILLGTALALLLGEGLVRLLGVAPEVGWIERGRFRLSENPEIVYEPVPALDYQGRDLAFFDYRGKGNQLGYRDVDHPPEAEPGVYRIVILGDSIAAGLGVERYEDTFPWLLEAGLRESGLPVETLNFGVSGYNSVQEVATLEERGLPFSPDLVLLAYCLNDGEPPHRGIIDTLERVASESGVVSRSTSHPLLQHSALYRLVRFRTPRASPRAPEVSSPNEPTSTVSRALARLQLLAERHRFDVLVVVFPRLERIFRYRWLEHHERMAAESESRGFYHLDLLPAFRRCWSETESKLARDLWHPTAAGQRCAADAMVEFILEEVSIDRPGD